VPLFHQQSRADLRRMYIDAWRKHQAGQPLQALEQQLANVIAEHPEYHALLDVNETAVQAEYLPESGASNPFLHMGMHLALREQVATDRPRGITAAHARLAQRLNSAHEAEHRMLEALGETLWEAQRNGLPPDETAYLERIARLISTG
jgi:hypothetical protein